MTVHVRDIVYSMTARTTSCFGGRFTLTGEILGRRSMRASDPPPVTMEARRGSTDAHIHMEERIDAHIYTHPTGEDVDTRSFWSAYAHAHIHTCVYVIRETSLSLFTLVPPTSSHSLSLFTSLSYSRPSVSLSSRTYGTVCHGQKLWQGVQGVQNQDTKSTVLLEMLRWA